MKKVITDYEISILDKISNPKNTGYFGTCYKYDDLVLKIYRNSLPSEILKMVEDKLVKLEGIKVDGVSFPIDLFYDDKDVFKGYSMPYYKGYNLKQILSRRKDITKEMVDEYYDKVLNKIIELSKIGILVSDIKPDNFIFEDNELKLVDCDFYDLEEKDYDSILKENVELLNQSFNKMKDDHFSFKTDIIYKDKDIEIEDIKLKRCMI